MTDVRIGVVGIGVAGAGNMGGVHARHLLEGRVPGGCLAGVCDVEPDRLTGFPVPGWADAGEMFTSGDLDAVVIATPHYSHVPLGIAALKAGLHVMMEKPIAVHKADAERLLAAHTNPAQVFSAMFNQRTDPRYRWLKAKIDAGELGRINRINWTITDWFRPQAYYNQVPRRLTWAGEGGGVLLTQCAHQLDLWQWLFGMPARVHAFCRFGRYHRIEVEDDVTAYLEYGDGLSGVLVTTTGEAPGCNRLEVCAENGRVLLDGMSARFERTSMPLPEFSASAENAFAVPEVEVFTEHFDTTGEQHAGVLKNFVAAIQGREALVAPAQEGLRSLELSNAILFSGLNKKTVELPLDAAAYAERLRQLIENSTFGVK